jgi:hypothetical protein
MDQEALVEELLDEGTRLDFALRRSDAVLESPVVALDVNAAQWAMIFGVPDRLSRRHVYELLQQLIVRLGLRISLDQIVLVKASDPGLRELRSLGPARARQGWPSDLTPVDVGGRLFVDARSARPSFAHFEDAVEEAIRSFYRDDALIERGGGSWLNQVANEQVGAGARAIEADLVIQTPGEIILVEAKAYRKPVGVQQVMAAFGRLSFYQRMRGQGIRIGMIVVSMSGFTSAAISYFAAFRDIALVSWSIGDEPIELADAFARIERS